MHCTSTGPARRFRRLAEHLTAVLQASNNVQRQTPRGSREPQVWQEQTKAHKSTSFQMVRPRRLSDSSVSSMNSDTETQSCILSHGLSQVRIITGCMYYSHLMQNSDCSAPNTDYRPTAVAAAVTTTANAVRSPNSYAKSPVTQVRMRTAYEFI